MNLDALLYTDEAATLAGVSPDLVRQWAHRYPDTMPVRVRDWRWRPMYRAGDVLEVERTTRSLNLYNIETMVALARVRTRRPRCP